MKFNNEPITLESAKIKVKFGTVTVSAQPYGLDNSFSEMWPQPAPPMKVVHGKNGSATPNYTNPEYRKELEEREQALMAYRFYMALRKDENVAFDSVPIESKDSLIALKNEISNSDIAGGDVIDIIRTANFLSGLIDDDEGELQKLFV